MWCYLVVALGPSVLLLSSLGRTRQIVLFHQNVVPVHAIRFYSNRPGAAVQRVYGETRASCVYNIITKKLLHFFTTRLFRNAPRASAE